MTLALQNEARLAGHKRPLLIGIDQENGQVTRITPPIAVQMPGPMALGATHDPELAFEVGKATGETLRVFGINMNYAPVCDINSEPLNPVIGVRSPGDDPEFVSRFASATARGLRHLEIVPSVKHFPGHGDTATDSHHGLPVIQKSRDDLERCELIPFRRAVAEGIETVMTAHISLPKIDDEFPATLSPRVMGILRKDMGYDGMIITDCLEMDGIRSTFGTEQGAVLALRAGSDSLMMCHTFDVHVASIKKVCDAIQSGEISQSRFEDASRRVAYVKDKFVDRETALRQKDLAELDALNGLHTKLSQRAYEHSVTVVRDNPHVLPLSNTSNIVFLFPGDGTPAGGAVDGEGMGKQGSYDPTQYLNILRRRNPSITQIEYLEAGLSLDQWDVVKSADAVIFVSMNAKESPYQLSLGKALPGKVQKLVAIAACQPYDLLDVIDVTTYIATYEPTTEAFSVAASIIFGEKKPKGTLPIGTSPSTKPPATVVPFDANKDLNRMISVWMTALPTYIVPSDSLRSLINCHNAHHFVALVGSELAGFCLAYTNFHAEPNTVHIAVVAVRPEYQGQGVGTKLLTESRSHFRRQFGINRVSLGSSFPRFWPGIPRDLPQDVQNFFIHRGFRLSPPEARSVDLYQDIRNFQPPEKYIARAHQGGFRFAPLQPDDYEGCLAGQRKNFSENAVCSTSWPEMTKLTFPQDWVKAYVTLHPSEYPNSVMTAFDSHGQQVGWTLMLGHDHPLLKKLWLFPSLCGPKTGLIGCVGVDADHRKSGIGLALLCHAIENMKKRGIEGVFVDWVALDGWYEQVGFKTWRSYRPGEI